MSELVPDQISKSITFKLLRLLEQDSGIGLCIDSDQNIIFCNREGRLLLASNSNEYKAEFRNTEVQNNIDALVSIQSKKVRIVDNWEITPIFEDGKLLGFSFLNIHAEQNYSRDLLSLSEAVHTAKSLQSLMEQYTSAIEKIVNTSNIFIALYDSKTNEYYLPFYQDSANPSGFERAQIPTDSFTNYVRVSAQSLLIEKKDVEFISQEIGVKAVGVVADYWLGVPLVSHSKVTGVMVVQSYDEKIVISKKHQLLLEKASQYFSEAVMVFRSLEETQRNKELLEVSNSMSKVSAFEYSVTSHGFLPIHAPLDCLGQLSTSKVLPFIDLFSRVKAEDKYHLEQDFLLLSEKKTSQIEHEIKLKDNNTVLKVFAFWPPHKLLRQDTILGIIQDITQLKQNEKVLQLAYDQVHKADQLKADFMSAFSYEVRTPINAIIGFSNLLIKPNLSTEDRQSYFTIVKQNGNNLIQTIDNIIDISSLESGKVKIHKTPLNLNRLLDQIRGFAEKKKIELKKENVEVVLHKSHKELLMVADETRLGQILKTLTINAITYTEQGYVQFGYHVIDRGQPLLEFFVKDTGSGIPTEKHDVLFDRYGRMEGNDRVAPGITSLGLSIAKDLVRLMGGEMTLESEEKKGTTFYFYLPLEKMEKVAMVKPSNKPILKEIPTTEQKKIRILVVEDNRNNYRLIEESFKTSELKTRFEFAENGLEAIGKLREASFDLILMDLRMPLMDGMQAGEYIRTKFPPPTNKIPMVALTANTVKETRRTCLSLGFNGFIAKPFLPDELVRKVREVMEL